MATVIDTVPDTHSAFGEFNQLIDGRSVASPTRFDVLDPSTGRPFAESPDATAAQLDEAVAAARRALPAWSRLGWDERGACLRQLAEAMRDHVEMLAELVTREQGKPLADARTEVLRSANSVERFSEQRVEARVLRDDGHERIEEHFRAAGVCAVISPWNMPIGLFALRVPPLLQTGSTVVTKPSPYTPLATLKLAELVRDIFPAGVLNVIAGRDPLGQWMTDHPGIDRISFTGSVRTGQKVMASAAGTLKRIGLELGGNDPAIVLDDVDVEEVAPKLLWGALRNCGQICMAIKRLYVPDALYEPMVDALARQASQVRLGAGMAEGTQLGPLQNKMQLGIVEGLLEDTRAIEGVRVLAGDAALPDDGYFVPATIVADIPDDARLVTEEQFGPVLPVLRYSDLDDAVARANGTAFGLGASVWGADRERAAGVAARLEAGTVWVNNHMLLDADTPFGGWKTSGIGRGNGLTGLLACMESQVIRVLKDA